MSRWPTHGLALCAFLPLPAFAAWSDLNGPPFLRGLVAIAAVVAFVLYAGVTSAVVKFFRMERRGVLILHGAFFPLGLSATVMAVGTGPGPQML